MPAADICFAATTNFGGVLVAIAVVVLGTTLNFVASVVPTPDFASPTAAVGAVGLGREVIIVVVGALSRNLPKFTVAV